jgi:hypothetical protein
MPLSHLILLVGLKRFSNPINPIIIPSKSGSIIRYSNQLPGKQPHNYGKSPFLMGEFTISMAIFQFAFCMFTRPGNQGILFMAPLASPHFMTSPTHRPTRQMPPLSFCPGKGTAPGCGALRISATLVNIAMITIYIYMYIQYLYIIYGYI